MQHESWLVKVYGRISHWSREDGMLVLGRLNYLVTPEAKRGLGESDCQPLTEHKD